MTENEGRDRRQLFACESCGIVYARYDEPSACRLCERSMFSVVHPTVRA